MQIRLDGIGKRFLKEWIFRNVHLEFSDVGKYALTGNNGSGKSTLLQLISGIGIPTEGRISYTIANKKIDQENLPKHISFSTPYQELPEELTGNELFDFHFKFRDKNGHFNANDFFELVQLDKQGNKQLKYYSSGMKQRMRLGLCLHSQADVYLLDEPTTNLDRKGIEWYSQLLANKINEKLFIISSNIEEEYKICEKIINITDFKPKQ